MGKASYLNQHSPPLPLGRKQEESEAEILQDLGASSSDRFFFCSTAQDATDQLFLSVYLDLVRETGRTHFILPSDRSHKRLEKLGCTLKTLPLNEKGQIKVEALEEMIRPRTILVSLPWADPLTGVIQPLNELIAVCRKKEVLVHVDGCFAIGKLFFRFSDLDADFFTFDGRYIHAPHGTAALLVHARTSLNSLLATSLPLNPPALEALSISLKQTLAHSEHLCIETARLRDMLERGVAEVFPDAEPLFSKVERLPNVALIAFPGISAETLLFHLERQGVFATVEGVAPLLMHLGVDPLVAHSAVSFALSYETTEEEILSAIETIGRVANSLKPLFGACLK